MSRSSISSRILSAAAPPARGRSLACRGRQRRRADDPVLPGAAAVEAMGVLVGEWGMSGVTGGDADAAGRLFTARQSIDWIEPGRSLGVVWSVMLEDGTKVTSGRGRINWDDIAGAVVNVYRGEEGGRAPSPGRYLDRRRGRDLRLERARDVRHLRVGQLRGDLRVPLQRPHAGRLHSDVRRRRRDARAVAFRLESREPLPRGDAARAVSSGPGPSRMARRPRCRRAAR